MGTPVRRALAYPTPATQIVEMPIDNRVDSLRASVAIPPIAANYRFQ
jgi:hypothetical protein